jgi:hypothetical protein
MKISRFMAAVAFGTAIVVASSMARGESPFCNSKEGSCEGARFKDYADTFCLAFEQVGHEYTFKREILSPMKKSPYNMDRFWIESVCSPNKIGGNTSAPIVHLAAEDAGGRLFMLEVLRHYYIEERKAPEVWSKVINAKSNKGHTVLDYIEHLKINMGFIREEESHVAEFVAFVCNNGGANAIYAGTCSGKGAPFRGIGK